MATDANRKTYECFWGSQKSLGFKQNGTASKSVLRQAPHYGVWGHLTRENRSVIDATETERQSHATKKSVPEKVNRERFATF